MIMFALNAELNTTRARQVFTVRITSQDVIALLDGARITHCQCATGVISGLAVILPIADYG